MRKRECVCKYSHDARKRLGLLVGVDVRLGLHQYRKRGVSQKVYDSLREERQRKEKRRRRRRRRRKRKHTSCFFSSTLSETASLVASRRVPTPASVWPFAISRIEDTCHSLGQRGSGGRERGKERLPLLPSLEAPDKAPWTDSLAWLTVFLETWFNKSVQAAIERGAGGAGGGGNSPD